MVELSPSVSSPRARFTHGGLHSPDYPVCLLTYVFWGDDEGPTPMVWNGMFPKALGARDHKMGQTLTFLAPITCCRDHKTPISESSVPSLVSPVLRGSCGLAERAPRDRPRRGFFYGSRLHWGSSNCTVHVATLQLPGFDVRRTQEESTI